MDNNEIYSRFGISKKLAYGLLAQSIIVILATIICIISIFTIETKYPFIYITNIISLITCISLLIYSFYGFNAKTNQEAFFLSAIILYIILLIFRLLVDTKVQLVYLQQ